MEINKNWRIEADNLNIILLAREKHKNGLESFEAEGYFPTVGHALKHLVNAEVRGTGIKDLTSVCRKISELHDLIDNLAIRRISCADFIPEGGKTASCNGFEDVTAQKPIKDTTATDVTPLTDGVTTQRACIVCGAALPEDSRKDALYCGGTCRVKAHRQSQAVLL